MSVASIPTRTFSFTLAALLAGSAVGPPPAAGQDAASIVAEMQLRQQQRVDGIENFTIVTEMLGNRIPQYFEAFSVEGMAKGFRLVPLTEIERRRLEAEGIEPMGSMEIAAMAQGYRLLGNVVASHMESEGLPIELPNLARSGGGLVHDMLMMAATYEENDGRADARGQMADLARFGSQARLVDTEQVAGRSAFHLRIDDFSEAGGGEADTDFAPSRASLWIDTEHYVPLRMLVEGEASADGASGPMTIEKVSHEWSDDEGLFIAHQEIMRLGGPMFVTDEGQREEMREALRQVEEMRTQLDALPENQRDMVMGRIAPQIAQLERMAAGEPLAVESRVVEVRINEGPPFDIARIVFGAGELGTPLLLDPGHHDP